MLSFFNDFKNLKLRFFSSLFLITSFAILFFLGNLFFSFFLIILFSCVLYEFKSVNLLKFKFKNYFEIMLFPFLLFFFLVSELFDLEFIPNDFNTYYFLIFAAILLNICFFNNFKNILNLIISNLIILSFFTLIKILLEPGGLKTFLFLVLLITVMDVSAYVGGSLFGKFKIAPKISQGKTVEGALIGLFFTIITSLLIKKIVNLSLVEALIIGTFVGILAFLGDLLESFYKRRVGVKDSGYIIPGHGGLLDRCDSYLLILPLLNFIKVN